MFEEKANPQAHFTLGDFLLTTGRVKTTFRAGGLRMSPRSCKKILLGYFPYLQMIEYSIVNSGLSGLGGM
jgi:hypothetical protein